MSSIEELRRRVDAVLVSLHSSAKGFAALEAQLDRLEQVRSGRAPVGAANFLYVDEDAGKYYYHALGSSAVTSAEEGKIIEGFREEEGGATLRWDGQKEGFEDDKLCRIRREDESMVEVSSDPSRESFLREPDANQQYWFEIAWRFGKQLNIDSWRASRDELVSRGRRIVKIVGFDGGRPMAGVPWDAVSRELNDTADVVIWDGDWFSADGWTKLIPEFLRGSSERIAVAFQKCAEVPGFHRQYWHVYKEFPGRVWMVVLDDDLGSLPQEVNDQVAWLEEQARQGILKKCWMEKYVGTAMRGRALQGAVPVIAMNGGGVAMAQAAIELMSGAFQIPWTVFPGERVGRTDDPDATLAGFLSRYPDLPNAKVVTN